MQRIAPALIALILSLPRLASAQSPEVDLAQPGRVSLGLSGLLGVRDVDGDQTTLTWTAGLDVSVRLSHRTALALRRLTLGAARTLTGTRWAVGASPAFEINTRISHRLEPFLQLGVALQTRFGGSRQEQSYGLAPFLDGGFRLFLSDRFSVAAEVAVHAPVSEVFLFGHELLPRGAVLVQGGLTLAFHLQP